MAEEVGRTIRRAYLELKAKPGRADSTKAIATTLRLFAAHLQATGVAAKADESFRKLSSQDRDRLFLNASDAAARVAKLKAVLPELDEHDHQQAISRERFDAVLDLISTKGVSDSYRWMADTVDSVLASRQASPIRNVKLAIRESGCDDFTRGCLAAEILADGICFAATFDPVAIPACAAALVAAAGMCLAALHYCGQ